MTINKSVVFKEASNKLYNVLSDAFGRTLDMIVGALFMAVMSGYYPPKIPLSFLELLSVLLTVALITSYFVNTFPAKKDNE